MPKLPRPGAGADVNAQDDPRRNPNGIYSGMTKRLAISDGEFVSVQNASNRKRKK